MDNDHVPQKRPGGFPTLRSAAPASALGTRSAGSSAALRAGNGWQGEINAEGVSLLIAVFWCGETAQKKGDSLQLAFFCMIWNSAVWTCREESTQVEPLTDSVAVKRRPALAPTAGTMFCHHAQILASPG